MKLLSVKLTIGLLCLATSFASFAQLDIEEIVVRSEFRPLPLMTTANSVSVVTADEIADRNASFLTEVLATAPNLNYSSGASRGRFFQIRGIGERSQFIDPLNPSVGLLVDGIDYSTLGNAATLFDVAQVEILRGPQGTLFGANALAGLINIRSNSPTDKNEIRFKAGAGNVAGNDGNIDSTELGLVVSGPLAENLSGRLAMQSNTSDGAMENIYLGRDDTQKIDEQTLRGKLSWQPSDDLDVQITLVKLDINNGYDAFTLDNSRQSLADQPGTDALDSFALSGITTWTISDNLTLEVNASTAQSDSEYSYDEDWTNPDICLGLPCAGWEYSSFDEYLRDTGTNTLDIRFLSGISANGTSWTAGFYNKQQQANLTRNWTYDSQFTSQYDSQNLALYGELTLPTSDQSAFRIGLRGENFSSDYSDNRAQSTDTDESLLGGHLTFESEIANHHFAYGRIARGYKTGGINVARGFVIPLAYKTESLWNYELGLKSIFASGINSQIALFYQDRRDAQVKQSEVVCSGNCEFRDYIENAAKAHSYGVEAEMYWPATDRITLSANIGLMKTAFDEYLSSSHVNAIRDAGTGALISAYDMAGEPLASSPEYQFGLGSDISLTDQLNLWIGLEARDKFRFSNRHLAEANAYTLLNARLVWNYSENIEIAFWGRNLTNKDYTTRGFGEFPNDPRDFYSTNGPYVQFGDPREMGVTFEYHL